MPSASSWMMNEDKYHERSKSAGVPTHCPLYWNGCPKAQELNPLQNPDAAQTMEGHRQFADWCPELLLEFGPATWSNDMAEHYLDCPLFSRWWWEQTLGSRKSLPAAKRSGLSRRLRYQVFQRDKHTCQYCGRKPPEVRLEVDHRIPVSKGGTDDLDNLITACEDCNRGKGDLLPDPDQGQ